MEKQPYQLEELMPIVAELAEKYTKYEHSSIPYEKAQELLEAVLYCIGELVQDNNGYTPSTTEANLLAAKQAYQRGKELVMQKVEAFRIEYNALMKDFYDYGSICLRETVSKAYPAFLMHYDAVFLPQESVITLDYPVLYDNSRCCGIDAVYIQLQGIAYEQKFLAMFPRKYILDVLLAYSNNYEELYENICEPVIINTAGHLLYSLCSGEKVHLQRQFVSDDYNTLQCFLAEVSKQELQQYIEKMFDKLIHEMLSMQRSSHRDIFYDANAEIEWDTKLYLYLKNGFYNATVRIYYAIQNKSLEHIFVL